MPSGIYPGGGGSGAGVSEITDGTNTATGNIEFVGATVTTAGVNGVVTIEGAANAVLYVAGLVAGGTADNYTAITAALTALGGNGGAIYLPAGTYGVSQPITLPAGAFLVGATGTTTYGGSSGYGTVLCGTSGFSGSELVHASGHYGGLMNIAVNAYANSCSALLIDAFQTSFVNCDFLGGNGANTIESTSNAVNTDLQNVNARSYDGTHQAINSNGSDWVGDNVRTLGPITFNAPGSRWTPSCHFSGATNTQTLATFEQDTTAPCYFDSALGNGTTATALISITGGTINLTGARFYQNGTAAGFPMITKTGGVLLLSSGVVASPGAAGQFSCMVQYADSYDMISSVAVESGALPATGNVATLYSGGSPGVSQNVTYNGVQQQQIPLVPQPLAGALSSVYR